MPLPSFTLRIRRAWVLFATIAVGCTAAASASPASALPTGTFKIQSAHGTCAEMTNVGGARFVGMEACGTADLDQQYIYDAITQQIRSVGNLGYCMTVEEDPFGGTVEIAAATCSQAAEQNFTSQDRGGGTVIRTNDGEYWNTFSGTGSTIFADPLPSNPGVNYFWRFPLI